jgi:hypothetical protein
MMQTRTKMQKVCTVDGHTEWHRRVQRPDTRLNSNYSLKSPITDQISTNQPKTRTDLQLRYKVASSRIF